MERTRFEILPDLFIRPDFDGARAKVTATSPWNCSQIRWQVSSRGKVLGSGMIKPVDRKISLCVKIPDFIPWTPDNPCLYTFKLKLKSGKKTLECSEHFGMRKFHVEGRQIFMNNQPFFIKGYIRGREAHEHPDLIGVSDEEYYAKNIRMAKKYGFNFVRFHSAIPPEEFFNAADRLGLLAHIEMRRYRGKYQKRDEHDISFYNLAAWRRAISRVRNHPSLMVYCIGNEVDNPGNNPRAIRVRNLIKRLDPTRLFIDTCSRGEFDRTTVDIDIQHMSYFCPFGEHDDMFEDTQNVAIYGSVTGRKMLEQDKEENPTYTIRREVVMPRPLIAHETGHYLAHHNLEVLEKKFNRYKKYYIKYHQDHQDGKPWWLEQLRRLLNDKGLKKDYPRMLVASRRFQFIWWKQVFESVRRSPALAGFHFLQLADTERYENTNGILDCFDDPKYLPAKEFLAFNADDVIIAHLPRRTFFEGEPIKIPVCFSHYSKNSFANATLRWSLKSKKGNAISLRGKMDEFYLKELGLHKLATIEIRLPRAKKAEWLSFNLELKSNNRGKSGAKVSNSWNLWLFPNRTGRLAATKAAVALKDVRLHRRYPQIRAARDSSHPEKLLITDHIAPAVLKHLEKGGDVLLLYRIDENRDRKAAKEKYYLPSTRDRFKGVIWDRGHNLGGFIRKHPALGDFPHDGVIDFQFYYLIGDCDKIDLDDFPCPVIPIIQGVDKAVRDRFDVRKFSLPDLVPEYTQRKFGYLFELRVGKGRLLVSGFNFTGLNQEIPETCYLFETLLKYVTSRTFQPKVKLAPAVFRNYLLRKGRGPRIKERMMTQYWQLDDAPLESDKYWRESEAYLREDLKGRKGKPTGIAEFDPAA